ncbi:hypothetical protein HNE_3063 [Hyphomonas neptunium ATCC 15444]|uniref:PilZ domain-containing protein n=2 Tax=Hyphomonas TaxID=85 RepID=Q0BXQ4_HYPNA|nr:MULTISPECIES: hypothetical protein [Hyphomonas]ABI78305.1 hypothetical protein HNE_3063 [Hyphomonas neptunium ATCC 15444]KCZ93571.1 hypothetical protein HHI_09252 [Hyphomonas hirschiana VP5]
MAILKRIFGNHKAGTVDPSRIARATTSQTGEDYARPVRAQVYREATITLESGYSRKGIVLDYTDTGLRIRFPTNESLPRYLTVNARSVGISGRAQVVWQKGSEIGLKLV